MAKIQAVATAMSDAMILLSTYSPAAATSSTLG